MTLEISPFDGRDSESIGALISNIQREEFQIAITLEEQPDLADIKGCYQRGSGNFWVARFGDRVVGTVALYDIGDSEAALRKMFVQREYRGGSFRVAERLLHSLFDWSKAQRIEHIYLGTTTAFLAAHRFYEKHGFTKIEKSELPASFPILGVDSIFYKLDLEERAAISATPR